jgi:sec-independent protein translocase protein TatC
VRLAIPGRRRKKQFERAADGSMTLMEHLYELRDRLFKASVAIVIGMIVGWFLAEWVLQILQTPYCDFDRSVWIKNRGSATGWECSFVQLGPADLLLLKLKVAMWCGLVVAAPFWLFQLWAFIAPGLHRHERRWTYAFAAAAGPLFALGAVLAYYVIAFGLQFLLNIADEDIKTTLEITRYISFVTGMMLIFGVAFEFPLAALLLNVAGVLSARRMLKWWRIVVFLFFLFSAVATPTGDPFGMSALAICLSALYFGAVGLAFINDKRRARKRRDEYGDLDDDEISPLTLDDDDVGASEAVTASGPVSASSVVGPSEPVTVSEPVSASGSVSATGAVGTDTIDGPRPLGRRYDDIT